MWFWGSHALAAACALLFVYLGVTGAVDDAHDGNWAGLVWEIGIALGASVLLALLVRQAWRSGFDNADPS